MEADPKVSVVVTCFNQEACASNSIESVLAQTHQNIECIIVDDGSTDSTLKLIRQFESRDTRIRVVAQHNAGVSAARNAGSELASGELLQFLDGDDTLDAEKIKRQVSHFREFPDCSVSVTNHRYHYVAENRKAVYSHQELERKPLKQILFGWHDGVSVPVHAPLYRREIWGGASPCPTDYTGRCEDWVFLVLTAARDVEFRFLDQVLCSYCVYGESFTSDVINPCTSLIKAAQYLEPQLPNDLREGFMDSVIHRSLKRYHRAHRDNYLHESGNWRLGNAITSPVFKSIRLVKKLLGSNRDG